MTMRAVLLAIAPLLFAKASGPPLDGPFEGLEDARRPARIEPYWAGLGKPTERAPAMGVVALRAPLERRVRIPGGRFVMGSTPKEMEQAVELCEKEPLGPEHCRPTEHDIGPFIRAEGNAHEVTLSDFEIDRTEVTVERYGRCVAAGACSPPSFPPADPRYDRPQYPVTHVRWQDAEAYCRWIDGRLPTEAEWEFAARGRQNRTFPWGELYNPRLANHGSSVSAVPGAFGEEPSDGRDGFVGLAPVGSFPDGASANGLLDMAGNVAEWVSDWYDRDADGYGYAGKAVTNPRGPDFGLGHVTRGGSYRDGAHWLRTAARRPGLYASRETGFRCAYDLGDDVAPGAAAP